MLVQDLLGLGGGPAMPVPEGAATAMPPPVAFSTFQNLAGTALLTLLALSLALVASLLAAAPPTWDTESPGPISIVTDGFAKGGTDRMLAMCSSKAWLTYKTVLVSYVHEPHIVQPPVVLELPAPGDHRPVVPGKLDLICRRLRT